MDDSELLRQYVRGQCQDAFRELVQRHVGMVYSTAFRILHDSHLAEDVAQEVFSTLARKAGTLTVEQVLGGWLYHTARNLALHAIRAEHRRREREQRGATMQALNSKGDAEEIVRNLEPAMAELEAPDRDVLVLRYLEERSLRDVGRELGITEDAARMRVNRAVERLRDVFGRHGLEAGAAGLVAALGAATSSAVPAGLALSITATALTGTSTGTLAGALAEAAGTAGSWLSAKMVAFALCGALLTGTGTYLVEHRQSQQWKASTLELQRQQHVLAARLETANHNAAVRAQEFERLQRQNRELARSRGELNAVPRRAAEDSEAETAAAKVAWSLDPAVLARNPPVVLLRPFAEQEPSAMISSSSGTIALGTYLSNVVGYAYNFLVDRILMPPEAPQGRFDFLVTLPTGGPEAMQQLLRQRFGLSARVETRQREALQLTLIDGLSPALAVSTKTAAAGGESRVRPHNGKPRRRDRIHGQGVPITDLAGQLEMLLHVPVVDATGLTNRYEYQLEVNRGASLNEVNQALSSQLGLELSSAPGTAAVDFLVVEIAP